MTLPVDIELQREKTKLLQSLQAEIATADNLALRSGSGPEVTQEQKDRLRKLSKELKLMREVEL